MTKSLRTWSARAFIMEKDLQKVPLASGTRANPVMAEDLIGLVPIFPTI